MGCAICLFIPTAGVSEKKQERTSILNLQVSDSSWGVTCHRSNQKQNPRVQIPQVKFFRSLLN